MSRWKGPFEKWPFILCSALIDTEDLPVEVKFEPLPDEPRPVQEGIDLNQELERLEKSYIQKALDFYKGNQTLAARALGQSERAIRYKMGKYGLKWPRC